jgi:hypothetical protein
MKARLIITSFFLTSLLVMPSCRTRLGGQQSVSRAEFDQQISELKLQLGNTRELLGRYEAHYGKLGVERRAQDYRKLRTQLTGKPASDVIKAIGKPDKVYSLEFSESWDYSNAAIDSITGRPVRNLEVWFKDGVVDNICANY